jgi:hypothetical protein
MLITNSLKWVSKKISGKNFYAKNYANLEFFDVALFQCFL